MYIWKNAWISITRNKGRNLLIGVIIMIIAVAATVALAIRTTAGSLIGAYEEQYDVTATIGVDRAAMRDEMRPEKNSAPNAQKEHRREEVMDKFAEATNLTAEDVLSYGESEYVQEYYYTVSAQVDAKDLDIASVSEGQGNFGGMQSGGDNVPRDMIAGATGDFTITGYSTLAAMEEFSTGEYAITEGEIATDFTSNSCVISADLASVNDLEIGDTITVVDPNKTSNTQKLTVTGIFEETLGEGGMEMFGGAANTIVTNSTVVETLAQKDDALNTMLNPTFVLTRREVVEDFEAELREKGLNENLTVSTNLEQVAAATGTVSNVSSFATTFLVVILVIGGIVLVVVNMINIRERRYEIGVLRTIGMKKGLLTGQFVAELAMVAVVALVIGAGIGALCSKPVSNQLLANEIANSQAQREKIGRNFGGGMGKSDAGEMVNNGSSVDQGMPSEMPEKINGVVTVQAFDSIDAVVNWQVLLGLLGIGIVLTLLGSVVAVVSIQRFSPLEILKERS